MANYALLHALSELDGNIGRTAKAVVKELAQYVSNDQDEAYPSVATLAHGVGITRETASRLLTQLEAAGLIWAVGEWSHRRGVTYYAPGQKHRRGGGTSNTTVWSFTWSVYADSGITVGAEVPERKTVDRPERKRIRVIERRSSVSIHPAQSNVGLAESESDQCDPNATLSSVISRTQDYGQCDPAASHCQTEIKDLAKTQCDSWSTQRCSLNAAGSTLDPQATRPNRAAETPTAAAATRRIHEGLLPMPSATVVDDVAAAQSARACPQSPLGSDTDKNRCVVSAAEAARGTEAELHVRTAGAASIEASSLGNRNCVNGAAGTNCGAATYSRSETQTVPTRVSGAAGAASAKATGSRNSINSTPLAGAAGSNAEATKAALPRILARFRKVFEEVQTSGALDAAAELKHNRQHCDELMHLVQATGEERTLILWASFLKYENHRVDSRPESRIRSWLLGDFVKWVPVELETRKLRADEEALQIAAGHEALYGETDLIDKVCASRGCLRPEPGQIAQWKQAELKYFRHILERARKSPDDELYYLEMALEAHPLSYPLPPNISSLAKEAWEYYNELWRKQLMQSADTTGDEGNPISGCVNNRLLPAIPRAEIERAIQDAWEVHERVLIKYDHLPATPHPPELVPKVWLAEFLADGKPHRFSGIYQAAHEAGIDMKELAMERLFGNVVVSVNSEDVVWQLPRRPADARPEPVNVGEGKN